MRKHTNMAFLLGLCCAVISCDPLSLTPQSAVTVPTYFKTADELDLYANQFYSNNFPGGSTIFKETGDNMIWLPLADEVAVTRVIPQNGGGWTFTALRNINFLLEHMDNCKDQAAVRKYTGVAKFFRAYFYFEKVKRFGDVPWYDHVLESDDPDLSRPRDSREFIMTRILADIDEAIELFKKENSQKDPYHVTWYTAQALKSRICLFEGTYRKYHSLKDGEKYLEACVAACEALMKSAGGYSLYTGGNQPYRDLFTSEDARTVEIILARDYDVTANLGNDVLPVINVPGQGRVGFTRKFVNSYLCSDGTRFTDKEGYESKEFKDEVVGRDPRLAQTIRTGSGLNFQNCLTGYQPLKYITDANFNKSNQSYNDMPLFRMAEVYLNYAEAKAELGTLTQADLDASLNKVRSRVKMPALDLEWANKNPDAYLISTVAGKGTGYNNPVLLNDNSNLGVILEIRRERNIELVMESQNRYWDLIRWKEGQCITQRFEGIYIPLSKMGLAYDVNGDGKEDICVYRGSRPSHTMALTWYDASNDYTLTEDTHGGIIFFAAIPRAWNEDRDYLYPVPKDEIILTNGKIVQNPNW